MRSKMRGCLVGGAVGDALGAPIEFDSLSAIRAKFGPGGPNDFVRAYGTYAAITDDTQMTLFTAEGLLRAEVRGRERGIASFEVLLRNAYLNWLATQGECDREDRWSYLLALRPMHAVRAPGKTCLSALKRPAEAGGLAINDSKGCGGVMRVAPVGLYWASKGIPAGQLARECFEMGAMCAALTHGHPTGQLAAGAFAVMIQRLAQGDSLDRAFDAAEAELVAHSRHEETLAAMQRARALVRHSEPTPQTVESLGGGWIAEEALAIAMYCSLIAQDFEHGVRLAVNHGGDSDSTGSMTGQLLGTMMGEEAIPRRWAGKVELGWLVRELADDLCDRGEWLFEGDELPAIWTKYAGC
jgi:ADP-ribosylglycohydrolase